MPLILPITQQVIVDVFLHSFEALLSFLQIPSLMSCSSCADNVAWVDFQSAGSPTVMHLSSSMSYQLALIWQSPELQA